MVKISFTITSFILCTVFAQGQNKRATFDLPAEVAWAGVDRPGDLFVVLKTGEVQKYDKKGKKLGSHGFSSTPALFEPLDGVQSFYYMNNETTYGNLSSDLQSTTNHPLDPAFANKPWLVCPSLHELWILDSADFTIKKTKQKSTTISLEQALKHLPSKKVSDYMYMREYQNFLFVLDKNEGIHLFNNLGNYVKTIGEKYLAYFNFLGEELYYLKGKEIVLVDLYTNEIRKIAIPIGCKFALITDDSLFAVDANKVTVFEFKAE